MRPTSISGLVGASRIVRPRRSRWRTSRRPGSRAGAWRRSRNGSCSAPTSACRACSATCAQTVLTDLASASVSVSCAEALVVVVRQRHPGDQQVVAPAERRGRGELPRVDRRGRRDDLEGRARGIAVLQCAVQQRRARLCARAVRSCSASSACWGHSSAIEAITFTAPSRGSSATTAPLCSPSAAIAVRCALGSSVGEDFVALPALALQLVEDRLQVRGARFPVQRRVAKRSSPSA